MFKYFVSFLLVFFGYFFLGTRSANALVIAPLIAIPVLKITVFLVSVLSIPVSLVFSKISNFSIKVKVMLLSFVITLSFLLFYYLFENFKYDAGPWSYSFVFIPSVIYTFGAINITKWSLLYTFFATLLVTILIFLPIYLVLVYFKKKVVLWYFYLSLVFFIILLSIYMFFNWTGYYF